jgi:hypothetical protein
MHMSHPKVLAGLPCRLEPNLQMLTDFCQDQYAQKLVGRQSIRPRRSRTTRALPGKPHTSLPLGMEQRRVLRGRVPVENRLQALPP